MTPLITVTPLAIAHIKTLLEKNKDAIGFRLSLKKTGCSGYSYVPDLICERNNADIHFVVDNLAVFIDPASAEFIKGLVIDYIAENIAGLKQKRLVFINPNEKNRCGCGESFTLE